MYVHVAARVELVCSPKLFLKTAEAGSQDQTGIICGGGYTVYSVSTLHALYSFCSGQTKKYVCFRQHAS